MNTNLFKLNSVEVYVTIGNKKVHPVNLYLIQEYAEHHQFEITLDYDVFGDEFMSNPQKQIELIGQKVVMRFLHKGEENDYYLFTGVITHVKQTGREGKKGYLVVSGASPTIMLEKGKRMDVYSNKTLRGVFELLVEGVHSNYLQYVNSPVHTNRIDFLMQYNESDWSFLQRIAYLYKENLFYSGSEILFGKYKEWDPVKLAYDREITDLEFCSQMLPNNQEYYQYVANRDITLERRSPSAIENTNPYLDAVEKQNTILTEKKAAKSYVDTPAYDSSEITDLLKREKSRNAAQTIRIKGRSKTYKSTIGRLIDIAMPRKLAGVNNIGTYRVVKSIHRIDEKLRYSNEFEAVPASLDTMPVKEPHMPQADSVIGKIRSNEDPLNQGRVQVDFDFARQYNFAWLRVLTPNAGSSEVVAQNRGMVFVPEKGDQVMIGFEYGDPNRPYVMGSLFHGTNGHGGGGNNAEKSIITRSGIQIVFNDDRRSLHIQDPSGNTWDMDGQGNISVFAPKDITLKASNSIRMEAGKDVNVIAAQEFTIDAMRKVLMNTPELRQMIASSWFLHSVNSTVLNDNDLKLESSNAYLSGTNNLFMHSEKLATLNSLGATHIKGKERNSFTNTTEQYETTKLEIPAKVLVHFRPKAGWRGEDYGFDWMRIQDTLTFGDNKYEDIVAYQYDDAAHKILTIADNEYEGFFKTDAAMYTQLKAEYKAHTIPWLTKKDQAGNDILDASGNPLPEEYFVSWLSLYPGREALLSLVLEAKEEASEIRFISNKTFLEVHPETIDLKAKGIRRGNADLPDEITVKCIAEFNVDQEIQVEVVKKDKQGNEISKEIGGKLKVWSNHAAKRKKRKVVFVNIRTPKNIDGRDDTDIDADKIRINQYLNQALLELDTNSVKINLDLTTNTEFTTYIDSSNSGIMDQNAAGKALQDFLRESLVAQEGNTYDSFFKCFYFADRSNDGTTGFSQPGADYVVVFDRNNDQTAAHEFFHSLKLEHSFTNKVSSPNAKFTYEYVKTDNIMDYSHHLFGHENDRISFWHWQWEIANNATT